MRWGTTVNITSKNRRVHCICWKCTRKIFIGKSCNQKSMITNHCTRKHQRYTTTRKCSRKSYFNTQCTLLFPLHIWHFLRQFLSTASLLKIFFVKSQCLLLKSFYMTITFFLAFTFFLKTLIATYGARVCGIVFKMEFRVLESRICPASRRELGVT